MQKIRVTCFYGLIAATAAVLFFCTFLQVKAGYFVSSETGFTHTHGNNCYKEVTTNCDYAHTMRRTTDSGTYYCTTCATGTDHSVVADTYYCSVKGNSWQKNGSITCKTCGTVHSRWEQQPPGEHTTTTKTLNCSIGAGEITAVLTINADDNWTNSGVILTADINRLKQDSTIGSVNYSWEGGKLYVTENGTYSVTASSAAGKSISASIEIGCIDKTPPVILSVSGNTGEMTKTAIYVNVNASDNESGLDAQAYSFDGGQNWGSSSGFLLEEGKDVQLAVRDKAGNIATGYLRRSAFPYPPEPIPSAAPAPSSSSSFPADAATSSDKASEAASDSAADSEGIGSASSENVMSASSKKADSGSSGKTSGETSSSAAKDRADRTSRTLEGKDSAASEKISTETDNNDSSGKEALDEEEQSGRDLLSMAGTLLLSRSAEIGRQKQAAAFSRLKGIVIGAKTAIPLSQRSTSGRIKINGDLSGPESFLSVITGHVHTHLQSLIGAGLLVAGTGLLFRLIWLHSAVLYCYNGGEEYRRIGLLHLRKKKQEFELYLPEYMLETKGTPRYRLMFKSRLVKKHGGEDLVVHGEDYKLRQPLEECVDFVL